MARTARIAYENRVLTGAVTASSEQFGFPATNLLNPERYVPWRSGPVAADQWVLADLGSAVPVSCILLADVVLRASGGAVRVQANATNSWGAPSVDVTVTAQVFPTVTGVAGAYFTQGNYRYVRVLWPSTGLAEQVGVGALYAGAYLQPTYSVSPGWGLKLIDLSEVQRATGGQRAAARGRSYWEMTARFEASPDAQRPALMQMAKAIGRHTPLFFAINPDDPAYFVFYGRFDEVPSFGHLQGATHWSVPFRFTEDVG